MRVKGKGAAAEKFRKLIDRSAEPSRSLEARYTPRYTITLPNLYGLGCVAYWLLTGHLVFEEGSSTATILAHVQNTPVAPSERCGFAVPASLERLTLACLAKSPADRPANAEAFSQLLADCVDAGSWTREAAELWWRAHLPQGTEPRGADGELRASASTAAITTL